MSHNCNAISKDSLKRVFLLKSKISCHESREYHSRRYVGRRKIQMSQSRIEQKSTKKESGCVSICIRMLYFERRKRMGAHESSSECHPNLLGESTDME